MSKDQSKSLFSGIDNELYKSSRIDSGFAELLQLCQSIYKL